MQIVIKTVLIFLLPLSVFGQIDFYKHYSNGGADFGEGLVQLEDSSYVICGSSSSFTNHSQAFLLKVDSSGNYIWSNNYGGFEQESARRVLYKKNFGFFIAGFTNSMGAGAYDYYLAKTDENGSLEWERTFGGFGWDRVRDAKMTRDTGVVLVGELSTTQGHKDWYIVRTDKNGDTLWTKRFGGAGDDVANCIKIYNDSLLLIGGTIVNQDSTMRKAFMVYMNDDGTVIDSMELGQNGNYELNDFTIVNDTIRGVGNYKLQNSDASDIAYYYIEIDSSALQLISTPHSPQQGDYYGQLITSYNNGFGRYIATGRANQVSVVGPGQDLFIAHYEPSWQGNNCYLTGAHNDRGGEFITTNDGAAAMVGWREGVGPGEGTIFLLKIGPGNVFPTTSALTVATDLVTIEEANEIEGISVFPIPTSNSLTLEIGQQGNYLVSIVNMLGEIVFENQIFETSIIDLSTFKSGNYFLKISTANGKCSTYKISKL